MAERCPEAPDLLPAPNAEEMLLLGSRMVRIFFRGGPTPTDWMDFRSDGPLSTGRFDHHRAGVPAGVMYLALRGSPPSELDALSCALAETFQLTRLIDASTKDPWVAWWTPRREVRLLDLGSTWLARAGGNQALCSGDRNVSRSWARAIQAAPWSTDIDGLAWPSSVLGPGRSAVLAESAGNAVPRRPDVLRPLGDPGLGPTRERAARAIGYSMA